MALQVTVLNRSTMSDPLPGVSRRVIMRGVSPLGNPFKMRDRSQAERDRVVHAYRALLREQFRAGGPQRDALEELYALALEGPLELVCCCAPLACHGDVVRDALLGMHRQRTQA